MELFGDWIATKSGMLGTLLAMTGSGEIAHAQTQPPAEHPNGRPATCTLNRS